MNLPARPASASPAQRTARPATQPPSLRPNQRLRLAGLALVLGALQACGSGGGSTPAPVAITPAVSAVSALTPKYGQTSTFTITGVNLPGNLKASVTGCSNMTMLTSSDASSRQFTCNPESTSIDVSVDYGVSTVYTVKLSVPMPQVTMTTSLGTIVVELDPAKAPITVKNFIDYVKSGFYIGTIFHRVVAGFVSQGGGFIDNNNGTLTLKANSTAPIKLESNNGLSNLKYSIAMARLPAADSATSQFYFNAANNTGLDYVSNGVANGYAVFGKVVSGTAVLDAINAVATTTKSSNSDVPVVPIVLQSVVQTQ